MHGFKPFNIGTVRVQGDAILAPMDGYSDLPFRVLTRRLGSAMSFTEFINAVDVTGGHPPYYEERLAYCEAERPLVYQIFDDEPQRMLKAALALEKRKPDLIDVNMGCPARTVSNRGAGSGLLREPHKIAEIFDLLTQTLKVPVSGKIRLGWDEHALNYLEVARIVEDHGGAMLSVHGRHRKQGYKGEADWQAIAEVKQALSIPVIGNGDVKRAEDIQKMLDLTGCDAVMIGRAARTNPWIFRHHNREDIPQEEVYAVIKDHLVQNLQFYGPQRGLILFRKFVKGYLSPFVLDKTLVFNLLTTEDKTKFSEILDILFSQKLNVLKDPSL